MCNYGICIAWVGTCCCVCCHEDRGELVPVPPPPPPGSCILGELFTKRPLFPGYTEIGQLDLIRWAVGELVFVQVCVPALVKVLPACSP